MKWPAPPLRRWTSAEEHKLREMLEAGKSVAEIAQQLDRTPKAIYARFVSALQKAAAALLISPSPHGRLSRQLTCLGLQVAGNCSTSGELTNDGRSLFDELAGDCDRGG